VGPNASGKTTFLDVIGFLSDTLAFGLDKAVELRTTNFDDLTFANSGGEIELAVEIRIPEILDIPAHLGAYDSIRYELAIGNDVDLGSPIFKEEAVLFVGSSEPNNLRTLFPSPIVGEEQSTLLIGNNGKVQGKRAIVTKARDGKANFYSETQKGTGKGWMPSFNFGPWKSALVNLPADLGKFPFSTWLKSFLIDGVQLFILDSLNIRKASGPGQGKRFKTDGSNLPWVIEDLRVESPQSYSRWIEHVRTALPDIESIFTVLREDDKHRYLKIRYFSGVETPSWMASDGTLRLLALTIIAYLQDFDGVFLIEEPENGIHPKAVETVFQSLSSVYDAQVLVASHSPVLLSMVDYKSLLCFAKTDDGGTDIVKGVEHPVLRKWKGETSLDNLFASGVLG
jgi:hypothetical protein